jgi:hypothetical protein
MRSRRIVDIWIQPSRNQQLHLLVRFVPRTLPHLPVSNEIRASVAVRECMVGRLHYCDFEGSIEYNRQ